jgi:anaerobic selenocysteine-containing dehydrogenase
MPADAPEVRNVHGYCSLCLARCGTVATVTDGRFTRLDPDPNHPTGASICAKGRAAPELALQLQLMGGSESMGNHDSGPDDWWCVG